MTSLLGSQFSWKSTRKPLPTCHATTLESTPPAGSHSHRARTYGVRAGQANEADIAAGFVTYLDGLEKARDPPVAERERELAQLPRAGAPGIVALRRLYAL